MGEKRKNTKKLKAAYIKSGTESSTGIERMPLEVSGHSDTQG